MNNKNPEVESESAATNLCKRGCGFYGSVQFKDMCSKCYHEFIQNEKDTQTSKSISGAFSTTESSINPILDELNLIKPSTVRADAVSLKRKLDSDIAESLRTIEPSPPVATPKLGNAGSTLKSTPQRTVNRCRQCRKRVGLTGFQCRCEGLFCALHRYSNQHDCTFNYRQQGQDQIARDNPEVRCPKIRKI